MLTRNQVPCREDFSCKDDRARIHEYRLQPSKESQDVPHLVTRFCRWFIPSRSSAPFPFAVAFSLCVSELDSRLLLFGRLYTRYGLSAFFTLSCSFLVCFNSCGMCCLGGGCVFEGLDDFFNRGALERSFTLDLLALDRLMCCEMF